MDKHDFLEEGDGFVVITLAKGGTLRMREPTIGDQIAIEKLKDASNAEREVRLFANLCEVDPTEIRALKVRDYLRVQKAFATFVD